MQAPPPVTAIATLPRGVLASALSLLTLGALQIAFFVLLQEAQALMAGLLIGLLLLAVMVVISQFIRPALGQLFWDGSGWQWSGGGAAVRCGVTVHLDLNRVVLVALQTESLSKTWLWLEAQKQPLTWLALRRALFADLKRMVENS